jgi:glycosyltransferase involved in cell wall biosynthesis
MKVTLFFTEGVALHTWHQNGMLARELAVYQRLQQQGIGVRFVTYGNRSDHALRKSLGDIELETNDLNLPIDWYKRKVELFPPDGDVFKSNQVAGADLALNAARRKGAKFVARCGYLLSEFQQRKYGVQSPEARAAFELESRVFGDADRVVVTTESMSQLVQSAYNLPVNHVQVIPNYVETNRFRPLQRAANSRFRVSFVGRLDVQKNVFALLEAVRDLDLELHIAGYGPQRKDLEEKASGGKADVIFHGSIPNADLPKFLADSDLFVLPSLYEGHPKSLIEAMAVGLPVIGTRVPGIENLLLHGETGYLTDPSPEGVRGAIETLMEDSSLRETLGQGARDFAENVFGLDRVFEQELEMLTRVVDAKS